MYLDNSSTITPTHKMFDRLSAYLCGPKAWTVRSDRANRARTATDGGYLIVI